jgi:hypothetical protein
MDFDQIQKRLQLFLIVAAFIILFDAVTAAASRALTLDYTSFGWASYFFYAAAGYFGHKNFDLPTGVAAGFVAGLADSTIGWYLSSLIGPFIPFAQPHYTPLLITVTIILVTLTGAFFGLLGSLLFKFVSKHLRSE